MKIDNTQVKQIYQSAFTILAYLYCIRGDYQQAIRIIREAFEVSYLSPENKFNLFMYLFEAYLESDMLSEANAIVNSATTNKFILECLNTAINGVSCRNSVGSSQIWSGKFSSKDIIYSNFAILHLKNGNVQQAVTTIN